jgi:POT family proton-dependent oligopeptide transporter
MSRFGREFFKPENLKALGNLLILVPFAAMFWALWQQNFSSWVLQADKLDRSLFGHEWLPAQIQTANSVFVLVWLPIFSYVIYPVVGRIVQLTPLRKFGGGLFMVLCAFLMVAWIQKRLDAGLQPNIIYQILAYLLLAAGEVMVSVTHLEFAYTQAPRAMKSLVMCTYLGSIALGNAFTAGVNFFIQNADGTLKLSGVSYFYFFVKIMLVTCAVYVLVARFYRGKTYIQDEQ